MGASSSTENMASKMEDLSIDQEGRKSPSSSTSTSPSSSDSTPSDTTSSDPQPLPAYLSMPIFRRVIQHLLDDAVEAKSEPGHMICERTCPDHETPFSQDLINLSMANSYAREAVWKARSRKIVIMIDEDFEELEDGVGPKYRGSVRDVIIKMPFCDCPKHRRQTPPTRLGVKWAEKANAFLALLPNVDSILDYNYGITYTGPADLIGPSLHHLTVRSLYLGFPFMTVKSALPLSHAYPALEELHIFEKQTFLFGPWRREQVGQAEPVDYKKFLSETIGGPTPAIRKLVLKLVLPSETGDGSLVAGTADTIFDQLLEYLPNIQDLEIVLDPTYTQNRLFACLLSIIMYKLSHKHLPLRQTDIQVTGFDWRRLNTASMLHKNWQMISLENLLPDSEQLLTNLKNLGKACPTLHRFGFAHINKMALLGGTGIIKTMDVRFPGAAHTCLLKHFLDPVVDTDSLNREALMSLQGRYERMIKENKARYEKGLPCNPPSHYNLSHFQPYHTDFSGVKYGFDLEFGE